MRVILFDLTDSQWLSSFNHRLCFLVDVYRGEGFTTTRDGSRRTQCVVFSLFLVAVFQDVLYIFVLLRFCLLL